MKTVKELQDQLNAKRAELAGIFEKAKTTIDGEDRYNLTPAQLEDVKARNTEIDAIAVELEIAKSVDSIYQANAAAMREGNRAASNLPLGSGKSATHPQPAKSLGQMFAESEAYKARQPGGEIMVALKGLDVKTLMETGAGWAPENVRTGKTVPYAVRRPTIADLMPNTQHDQAAVLYMEETTSTNAADTVVEGGSYPESALAWTERTVAMFKIATFLPVTDEQLKYVSQVRSIIDNRLLNFLKLAEEAKLISGAGTTDIEGFLVKSGVQSQAKGSDPTPDAIYKAMTLVRYTGFAEPSGIVIHPNDWEAIRLLRTTDGIYIWGSPADAGAERIWGLPAIITTAETENTALLGDFQMYSELFRGGNVEIKASDSHSDYFIKGKWAIKATEYATLAIYRAAAFCKVTGI
jgi:HK97 family phage major capsid protein